MNLKFAISNIAWNPLDNESVAILMKKYGISGIEVAPATIHNPPLEASNEEISKFKAFWQAQEIEVCALQALLYGAPYHMAIFEGEELQSKLLSYLDHVFLMAKKLGAVKLVFGSPKNRLRRDLPFAKAFDIATAFFRKAGENACKHNVQLCIEPNPPYYGCDFITTSPEALDLVKAVNSPGFGLHLDLGGMILSGENIAQAIEHCSGFIKHFHLSEKDLMPLGSCKKELKAVFQLLEKGRYENWISIEMKTSQQPLVDIENAFQVVAEARS